MVPFSSTFYSPDFADLYLFDVAIAPDNTFYVLGDFNYYTAAIVHMDLSGNTLGEIIAPVSDNSGYLSPEGFGLDPRDGSFWIGLVNTDSILHIDSSGNYLGEYYVGHQRQRRGRRTRRVDLLHQYLRWVDQHARSEHGQCQLSSPPRRSRST